MKSRMGAAAAMLFCAATANAQSYPRFDVERLMLDPAAHTSLVIGGGEVGPSGSLRLSLAGHWEHAPLVLQTSNDFRGRGVGADADLVGYAVRDRLTFHLGVAYALADWFEVYGTLPFIAYQDTPRLPGYPALSDNAVGTPTFGFKAGLLRQENGAPINLAVAGDVRFSTTNFGALASDDDTGFTPRVELGRRLGKVALGGMIGGLLRASKIPFGAKTLQHELLTGVVLATTGAPLRAEISGRGTFNFEGLGQHYEALAGVRYAAGPFEAFALGGPGFAASPGTPTWRALLGIALNVAPQKAAPPPPPVDPCAPGQAHTPEQCPDLDDDGDGVPNRLDKCPLVKGPAENNGCPDTDRDQDGIPDRLDKCPDEPGTPEYQGCPPPKRAVVHGPKIELEEKVYFDTGKATIQQRSNALLDEVATVMKAHPEIKKVVVEGHTDSAGSAATNQKLSQARAAAVREYLVKSGVEAGRLEAKGFGATKPVASNKTREGREQNRRVELRIAE